MPPLPLPEAATPGHAQAPVALGLNVLIDHAKKDLKAKANPPFLSHYRVLPENVRTAYDLFLTGAQLVRATATKYALVGAASKKDQVTLGNDLLRGCELIGAAVHATVADASGCSRAVRHYNQKAALAVYLATLRLVEAFHPELQRTSKDGSVRGSGGDPASRAVPAASDNTVGAQKTGAVWEACDHILNKMLPQGNRSAIRREIFTWTRECNDTLEEFDEMVQLGPREGGGGDDAEGEEDDDDDGFCGFGGDDDKYTEDDLPLAEACVKLLKNSRGNMRVALETCEALGERLAGSGSDKDDETILDAILRVHEHAKNVGEGVTDFGSLLYPPLVPSTAHLEAGVRRQAALIREFQDCVLGLEHLPTKTMELARTLRATADTREKDFFDALAAYKNKAC
ncbi:unnamed protein product [Pseudo-nitzschia multistriata]|uniref:Cyclin-D1-binding protein 1-like N-terminal domain-containing protein n=1 Tax=Pseudo-nitzschia multistriata TaxID=183589 RepID=A0A448ZKD6_9STRA|nr:unnamed protein product [Pseudo-nitzschia multistriata]